MSDKYVLISIIAIALVLIFSIGTYYVAKSNNSRAIFPINYSTASGYSFNYTMTINNTLSHLIFDGYNYCGGLKSSSVSNAVLIGSGYDTQYWIYYSLWNGSINTDSYIISDISNGSCSGNTGYASAVIVSLNKNTKVLSNQVYSSPSSVTLNANQSDVVLISILDTGSAASTSSNVNCVNLFTYGGISYYSCSPGASGSYSFSNVFDYILIYGNSTSTSTTSSTSLNSGNPVVENVTITNNANVTLYNQMILINSSESFWSSINNSNGHFGQNVKFEYANKSIIPSWLEYYNSTRAIWWLKLKIPAGGTESILLNITNRNVNLFNKQNIGEAPILSSTYGEYDDGANVFEYYANFSGNALSSYFSIPSGASAIQNNGVTFNISTIDRQYNAVYDIKNFSMPFTLISDVNYNPYTGGGAGNYMFGIGIATKSGASAGNNVSQMIGVIANPNYAKGGNMNIGSQNVTYLKQNVSEGGSQFGPYPWVVSFTKSYAYFSDTLHVLSGAYSNPQITSGYITFYFSNNNANRIATAYYVAITNVTMNEIPAVKFSPYSTSSSSTSSSSTNSTISKGVYISIPNSIFSFQNSQCSIYYNFDSFTNIAIGQKLYSLSPSAKSITKEFGVYANYYTTYDNSNFTISWQNYTILSSTNVLGLLNQSLIANASNGYVQTTYLNLIPFSNSVYTTIMVKAEIYHNPGFSNPSTIYFTPSFVNEFPYENNLINISNNSKFAIKVYGAEEVKYSYLASKLGSDFNFSNEKLEMNVIAFPIYSYKSYSFYFNSNLINSNGNYYFNVSIINVSFDKSLDVYDFEYSYVLNLSNYDGGDNSFLLGAIPKMLYINASVGNNVFKVVNFSTNANSFYGLLHFVNTSGDIEIIPESNLNLSFVYYQNISGAVFYKNDSYLYFTYNTSNGKIPVDFEVFQSNGNSINAFKVDIGNVNYSTFPITLLADKNYTMYLYALYNGAWLKSPEEVFHTGVVNVCISNTYQLVKILWNLSSNQITSAETTAININGSKITNASSLSSSSSSSSTSPAFKIYNTALGESILNPSTNTFWFLGAVDFYVLIALLIVFILITKYTRKSEIAILTLFTLLIVFYIVGLIPSLLFTLVALGLTIYIIHSVYKII